MIFITDLYLVHEFEMKNKKCKMHVHHYRLERKKLKQKGR